MKKTKLFTLFFIACISVNTKAVCQSTILGNTGTGAEYLGWSNNFPLNLQTAPAQTQPINFFTNNIQRMTILGTNGNVGIGTAVPTTIIGIDGTADQTVQMELNAAGNDGHALTIQAGGATSGTDKIGGNLNLRSGQSSGTGDSKIQFFTAPPSNSTGTTVHPTNCKMIIDGNGHVGTSKI